MNIVQVDSRDAQLREITRSPHILIYTNFLIKLRILSRKNIYGTLLAENKNFM